MDYLPSEPNVLDDRYIMITGAGRGIGREAALTYARHGARVIILGRDKHKLDDVAQAILAAGGQVAGCIPFDLASAASNDYQDLATRLTGQIPRLDGLLHNAGILGQRAPIVEQNPDIWHQVMQINLNGGFMLTQALLPLLLKSPQSSLVFTSSSVGHQGRALWGAYAVSKFATEGLMQVLADEYRDTGLRVNCINPGGTRTAMRASAFPQEDPTKLKTPADLMPLYLWAMSDASQGQTGQCFDAQPHRQPGEAK